MNIFLDFRLHSALYYYSCSDLLTNIWSWNCFGVYLDRSLQSTINRIWKAPIFWSFLCMIPDFLLGSKCINLLCIANRNNHRMGKFLSIILIFGEMVGKAFGYTSNNLISLWSPPASWTACICRGMLLAMDLSLLDLRASQATITASRNCLLCCRGVINITNMGKYLIPKILNRVHIRAFGWPVHDPWCGALSWTSTKLLRNVSLVQGKGFCLSTPRWTCWFKGSSTMTSSLLPLKWKAPNTVMGDTTLPSVFCTQVSINLSPSRVRTRIWPSLRYRLKRDSSEKTQYLQWRRSHTRCHCAHCRRRQRCRVVSRRHPVGLAVRKITSS